MARLSKALQQRIAMGIVLDQPVSHVAKQLGLPVEQIRPYFKKKLWKPDFAAMVEEFTQTVMGSGLDHHVKVAEMRQKAWKRLVELMEQDKDPRLAADLAMKFYLQANEQQLLDDSVKKQVDVHNTNTQVNFMLNPKIQKEIKGAMQQVADQAESLKTALPSLASITDSPHISLSKPSEAPVIDITADVPKESPPTKAGDGVHLEPVPEQE